MRGQEKRTSPYYRLEADGRFDYLLSFSDDLDKSREDRVIDFLRSRFTGEVEYTLRAIRTYDTNFKKERKSGRRIMELSQDGENWIKEIKKR